MTLPMFGALDVVVEEAAAAALTPPPFLSSSYKVFNINFERTCPDQMTGSNAESCNPLYDRWLTATCCYLFQSFDTESTVIGLRGCVYSLHFIQYNKILAEKFDLISSS